MIPEPHLLAFGALAGAGLGGAYFGALWVTVRRAVSSPRPRTLLAASVVVRLAGVMAAFYALLQLGPAVLGAAVLGFLAARQAWLWAKGKGARPSGGARQAREGVPSP